MHASLNVISSLDHKLSWTAIYAAQEGDQSKSDSTMARHNLFLDLTRQALFAVVNSSETPVQTMLAELHSPMNHSHVNVFFK